MKVKIKKYATWLGPYQLVEKIFFWARQKDALGIEREADWVYNIGDWLAHTWFGDVWSRVAQGWVSYHDKRRVKVRIDRWDTWNMDDTLAHIVVPMLIQLKETKHGAPYVYPEDVPSILRPTKDELTAYATNGETDPKFFERWEWVMNEMIFAFSCKLTSWEEQFYSGEADVYFEKLDDASGMSEMKRGPKDTFKVDYEAMQAYQDRMTNGFRLFGKYYEGLWD